MVVMGIRGGKGGGAWYPLDINCLWVEELRPGLSDRTLFVSDAAGLLGPKFGLCARPGYGQKYSSIA